MNHPGLGFAIDDLDITDPNLYSQVMQPFETALKLPALAYQSKTFSDLEDENIWSRSWVAIGTTHQIPHAGDMLPYTVGHHGIHVQRLNGNTIIGRFNKAQHGGCRAIPAQCQTGNKTKCSFTSCGYSRDSQAINNIEIEESNAIAHQYLGVVPERLLTTKTYQLGPYIFVNLDPELSDNAEPAFGLSAEYVNQLNDKNNMVYSDWVECNANWKLLCNAILQVLDPHRKEYSVDSVLQQRESQADAVMQITTNRIFSDKQDYPLIWIAPNLFILMFSGYTLSLIVQPTGLKQSLIRVIISSAKHEAIDDSEFLSKYKDFIDQVVLFAADHQQKFNTISLDNAKHPEMTDTNSIVEESNLADYFNKVIAQKIFKKHSFYWNVPLFKNVL